MPPVPPPVLYVCVCARACVSVVVAAVAAVVAVAAAVAAAAAVVVAVVVVFVARCPMPAQSCMAPGQCGNTSPSAAFRPASQQSSAMAPHEAELPRWPP